MTTRNLQALVVVSLSSLLFVGCRGPEQAVATAPPPPVTKAHMNMLQLMRAFPFPHANVLFDAQDRDPEGADKQASMAFSVYRWGDADSYAGWAGVESSALALAEMAPILLTPRLCANGKPAPVEREDWKAAVRGLVAAGEAAHKAARSRNLEAMVEVSDTLTNACAACHDIYRDVDLSGGERCSVPK